MFWNFCTAYILFITITSFYSAVFVDATTAADLGKTACIAMIYAVTVKYCFPALDAWRKHKQENEVKAKS